jgi:hypothetical protein
MNTEAARLKQIKETTSLQRMKQQRNNESVREKMQDLLFCGRA